MAVLQSSDIDVQSSPSQVPRASKTGWSVAGNPAWLELQDGTAVGADTNHPRCI